MRATAIHASRSARYTIGGYWSGTDVKISPSLNQMSESENDSSTSRSRVRIDSSRPGRASGSIASRKIRHSGIQIAGRVTARPKAPS